jgi:predicted homoserine dehydrogenase-like protein
VHGLLAELEARETPLRVGVVGAGKFATMFLTQARRLRGLEIAWVADLDPQRARAAAGGAATGTDAVELIAAEGADVVVEATGSPAAGARHALAAFEHGQDVVMVTVEADALVGPVLARRAAEAGVVYSLAHGDQPALVCELVEWARVCGFEVVCAGKGTRYEPGFELSTPDTVWEHYGFRPEDADPQMFNSFVDGTKSAIEMAAVCNATGLEPQKEGLRFPALGRDELARLPDWLSRSGTVEVLSGEDMRWGVFVVFSAEDQLARRSLREYGVEVSADGRFGALFRPCHLVGLELAVSVLQVGLRGLPTGSADAFRADVVSAAKHDLEAGTVLDGEGGYHVYGALATAERTRTARLLPIGLSAGAIVVGDVPAGQQLSLDDVELQADRMLVELRGCLEQS